MCFESNEKIYVFKSQVRSTRMNQDSTLAKRMMFIILTDFACWFPVIIISILALTGNLHDPTKQVYAWIAVFVLPINSSINPLLYTFSTSYVRKTIPNAERALRWRKTQHRREGSLLMKLLSQRITQQEEWFSWVCLKVVWSGRTREVSFELNQGWTN